MSFTGQLGTPDSMLGWIVLGAAPVAELEAEPTGPTWTYGGDDAPMWTYGGDDG